MNGADIIPILKRKGIHKLFHANTVTTACTFIQAGGLASRGYVEKHSLRQTPQASDTTDKQFCIWHDVWLDTDDIHARINNVNFYGPVLFEFAVEMLAILPSGTDVLVTKSNPFPKWKVTDVLADRYFLTPAEVDAHLQMGSFDQCIVLRTPHAIAPFPFTPVQITLDDPLQPIRTNVDMGDAYTRAEQRLTDASRGSPTNIALRKRNCSMGCKCRDDYSKHGNLAPRFDLI